MRARFTPAAQADIEQIAYHIALDNPERASSFVSEIVSRCDRLSMSPKIGRLRPEFGSGIRSVPHSRYVIFYRAMEEGVEILHVLHGARDLRSAW